MPATASNSTKQKQRNDHYSYNKHNPMLLSANLKALVNLF